MKNKESNTIYIWIGSHIYIWPNDSNEYIEGNVTKIDIKNKVIYLDTPYEWVVFNEKPIFAIGIDKDDSRPKQFN